jgi:hypothetical protein
MEGIFSNFSVYFACACGRYPMSAGSWKILFSGKCDPDASKKYLRLFEFAPVLVRFNHVASIIVDANHSNVSARISSCPDAVFRRIHADRAVNRASLALISRYGVANRGYGLWLPRPCRKR